MGGDKWESDLVDMLCEMDVYDGARYLINLRSCRSRGKRETRLFEAAIARVLEQLKQRKEEAR